MERRKFLVAIGVAPLTPLCFGALGIESNKEKHLWRMEAVYARTEDFTKGLDGTKIVEVEYVKEPLSNMQWAQEYLGKVISDQYGTSIDMVSCS